jgi:hypothetical protein
MLNHHNLTQVNRSASFPSIRPAQAPAVSQNIPSFSPIAPPHPQSHSFQNVTQNMLKDQILMLLLSQQRSGGSNINSAPPAQMAAPANHLESLLRSIATGSYSNSTPTQAQGYATASAAYQPLEHQSTNNTHLGVASSTISNTDSKRSASDINASVHASHHQSRDKRWMMRYEELSLFQKVRCHKMLAPRCVG